MNSIEEMSVGNIVSSYPTAATVFAKYGIDFCCGGKRPLKEVCDQKGINSAEITQRIFSEHEASSAQIPRFKEWSPDFLCNYIEHNHHNYVKSMIPVISRWMNKIAAVHGEWKPENVEIDQKFGTLAKAMNAHLQKEEEEAFPLIRKMVNESGDAAAENAVKFEELVREMEEEHDEAGSIMQDIRKLSNDFTPPADACNTYMAAYDALAAFEADLHQHVHLENNVLFPKALTFGTKLQENI